MYFGGVARTRNQLNAFQFCGDFSDDFGSTLTEYEAFVEKSSGKYR